MWSWLRNRRFNGYKFRREHPVGPYVLDFYCDEAHLSIELDGRGHGFPGQMDHDEARAQYLRSLGIKELRFWNSRLRTEKESIRNAIYVALQQRAPQELPPYVKRAGVPWWEKGMTNGETKTSAAERPSP